MATLMIRLLGRLGLKAGPARGAERPGARPVSQDPQRPFAGRRVLVVGGGRIGRATSTMFCTAGARVHQADIRADRAPEGVIEHVVDVADVADIDRFWSELQEPIDLLVYAAGYQAPVGPFERSDPAQWRRTFDTNLFGLMRIAQLVGADLKARRRAGSMIFISSAHAAITGGWPDYAASKAAVVMFMRELALEWAPWGIRVNAIAPGWVAHSDELHANNFPHTPLGRRAIAPEDIARAVLFLASDSSSSTTGSVLSVDGGLSLRSYRTAANVVPADPHVRRYDDD